MVDSFEMGSAVDTLNVWTVVIRALWCVWCQTRVCCRRSPAPVSTRIYGSTGMARWPSVARSCTAAAEATTTTSRRRTTATPSVARGRWRRRALDGATEDDATDRATVTRRSPRVLLVMPAIPSCRAGTVCSALTLHHIDYVNLDVGPTVLFTPLKLSY